VEIGTSNDTPEMLSALRREVRGFLADEITTGQFVPEVDGWGRGFSRRFSLRLAARGWVGMTIPASYGGGGRTHLERFVVAEECLAAGAPVLSHWAAERQIAPMLVRLGTEAQKELLLPRISRGELTFGIGLSEPDAGSDLSALRTRAHRVAGGWSVTGQKVWTSAGHHAEYIFVLCRTSDETDRRHGLSQLMVEPSAAGVEIRPIDTMDGKAEFSEVFLNDAFVPDHAVIGEIGRGWQQVTQELGWERSGPDRYLTTYPLLNRFFALGDPVRDREVGSLVARITALRALSMQVAAKGQAGHDFGADAALAKDAGTVFEQESVEVVRRAIGLDCPDYELRELLTSAQFVAPSFTLRGGTNEILRGITAKQLAR
jgi:acyl-CoA dehydrogenase